MESKARSNLQGLKVVSFESRRAQEMAELIRRYGGEPIIAPSMREIPLTENRAARDLLPAIEAVKFDILILMTGVGIKTLNEVLLTQYSQERIVEVLKTVQLIARGPKPVGVLKELGLQAAVTVPEPNTWREVLSTLEATIDLSGIRIAIQEYGIANPELIAALESRGATVTQIPIYRWALPEDMEPLRQGIQTILRGEVDVAIFTNSAQVDHLFRIAAAEKIDEKLRLACKNIVIASVGPICTKAIQQFGLKPDIEPAHPKMGALIAAVAASAQSILSTKNR
ncbi:MAG TPA: uroporphyrinogen-III synthase [Candidatus Limnocylindrales bacterium]|nr:uroporphyrinogen-III synthase [Candidatus Limnocylindrales bacterium]